MRKAAKQPAAKPAKPVEPGALRFTYQGKLRERPAPTSEQFAATERRVGAELPRDYKDLLTRHNGGIPDRSYLAVGRLGLDIECFHHIDGAPADVYHVEAASTWPSADLGEQVVAFASDGAGDRLIFRREGDAWRIYWWHHDEQPALEPIPGTLSELLARLAHPK